MTPRALPRRRTLLRAALGTAASLGTGRVLGQARPKVVIVGAGWAGLSAAHALRAQPVDVLLLDRLATWQSLPLSNPWLAGHTAERLPRIDLAAWSRERGLRFAAAEVSAIDREARTVHAGGERHPYDALVLATGAECDHAAWLGDDPRAVAEARSRFPSGFVAGELDALKQRLDAFTGGTLLMTVPPAPLRCPPAPYERAVLVAESLRRRGLKARLLLLDAGAGTARFSRIFADRFAGLLEHRPYTTIRRVDPFARTVVTDDGDEHFDHAMLLPPMRAGALVARAGLLGRDAKGQPTRWAAVDAAMLRAPGDERVVVIGDVMDAVSPLFGGYPKTAQIAAELGAAAALGLSALWRGAPSPVLPLPHSVCHVWLGGAPAEQLQIEAGHRWRGDGVLQQSVRQTDNPQPRDEDLAWARTLMAERLGVDGR